jgi:hypothetical protein
MQNRTDPWQAAGYLGMSLETLLRVYASSSGSSSGRRREDHSETKAGTERYRFWCGNENVVAKEELRF